MNQRTLLEGAAVLIEDGRICEIRTDGSTPERGGPDGILGPAWELHLRSFLLQDEVKASFEICH